MRAYLDLMREALDNGAVKMDRTGTGVRSLFGRQLRFDLTRGFPLVTTKRLHLKSIVRELVWFLRGDTNIAYLKAHGVSIWDEWADADGDLGPVYGKQWRAWEGPDGRTYDQIAWVIDEIRRNPEFAPTRGLGLERGRDREHEARPLPLPVPVLCQRRPALLPALPALGRHLSRRAVQHRKLCALDPSHRPRMRARGGGVRAYVRRRPSLPQSRRSGARAARPTPRPLPKLVLGDVGSIFDLNADAIAFEGYDPWPAIKAKVAV